MTAFLPVAIYVGTALVLWSSAGRLDPSRPPLVALLVTTALLGVSLVEPGQRWLGRGDADARVWLRIAVPCSLWTLLLAPTGLPFAVPVIAASIAGRRLLANLTVGGVVAGAAGVALGGPLLLAARPLGIAPRLMPARVEVLSVIVLTACSLIAFVVITYGAHQFRLAVRALSRAEEQRHELLAHAATHDPLTGLHNRRGLLEALSAAAREAAPGRATAVLYLDLDGFKPVNDAFGHAAGDELLAQVSRRFLAAIRDGDVTARVGGDEFVVLLRAVADPAVVEHAVRRLRRSLERPFEVAGTPVHVGTSIGTALTEEPREPEDLLRSADAAMYAEKQRPGAGAPGRAPATPPALPPAHGWGPSVALPGVV